jgi:membrane associated rhomboid family serine protease
MMDGAKSIRITPWVGRLMAINLAMLLLLSTVFTAPRFTAALTFDPAQFTQRPWTAITYMFVHAGPLHLALNLAILFGFGPAVERKLGSRRFIVYFLYCGLSGAMFALAMAKVLRVDPFVGASGALYGVILAFAMTWPEAQLNGLFVSVPITIRRAFFVLVGADLVLSVLVHDGIAHLAHVGGAAAGYLFFWAQSLANRRAPARPSTVVRRPVVTPMRVEETVTELRPISPPVADRRIEVKSDELDRVLDKISQSGIESLTSQERKFLAEVAERKRREQH